MQIAVIKETLPGETRVALVPAALPALTKAGLEVLIQSGAGVAAGFPDEQYVQRGARIVATRHEAFAAEIVLQVRALGANLEAGKADLEELRKGQVLIGMCDPLGEPEAARQLAQTGATVFALELIPRITRAQSMDVLSSMATLAGYGAVLTAAMHLPKIFPMLMTAAGTLSAARVFIIGAGVAGLQAIATAKRLGAIVHAYDLRPAAREQIESVGAKVVELDLETGQAEGAGGYARAMDEEFYRKQREQLGKVVADSDVVITTAAVPGRRSPVLVTAEAARGMRPGSVIVDLAAERGGNCELTKADQVCTENGVTIVGPCNLPAQFPFHASQMYAKNIATFLLNMVKDKQLKIDRADEIVRETLIAGDGEVQPARLREMLKLDPLPERHDPGPAEKK